MTKKEWGGALKQIFSRVGARTEAQRVENAMLQGWGCGQSWSASAHGRSFVVSHHATKREKTDRCTRLLVKPVWF